MNKLFTVKMTLCLALIWLVGCGQTPAEIQTAVQTQSRKSQHNGEANATRHSEVNKPIEFVQGFENVCKKYGSNFDRNGLYDKKRQLCRSNIVANCVRANDWDGFLVMYEQSKKWDCADDFIQSYRKKCFCEANKSFTDNLFKLFPLGKDDFRGAYKEQLINSGQIGWVEYVLDKIDPQDHKWFFEDEDIIYYAINTRSARMVRYVFDNGAIVTDRAKNGPILDDTLRCGNYLDNWHVVKLLWEKGCRPQKYNLVEECAAAHNRLCPRSLFRYFIDEMYKYDKTQLESYKLWEIVGKQDRFINEYWDIVKLLLDKGIEMSESKWQTQADVLICAVYGNQEEIALQIMNQWSKIPYQIPKEEKKSNSIEEKEDHRESLAKSLRQVVFEEGTPATKKLYIENAKMSKDEMGEALFLTIAGSDLETVKFLVEAGADLKPRVKTPNNQERIMDPEAKPRTISPLSFALERQKKEIVQYLKSKGCKPEEGNYQELANAIMDHNWDGIVAGMKDLKDYNEPIYKDLSPLQLAAADPKPLSELSEKEITQSRLKHLMNSDFNKKEADWLRKAFGKNRNLEQFKKMITEFKLDPNAVNPKGQSPLFFALEGWNIEVVEYLIDDLKVDMTTRGQTVMPIWCAVRERALPFLFEKGFDISKEEESYVVQQLIENGRPGILEKVINHFDIKLEKANDKGETLAHVLLKTEQEPSVTLFDSLRKRGVDFKAADRDGKTVLHLAAGLVQDNPDFRSGGDVFLEQVMRKRNRNSDNPMIKYQGRNGWIEYLMDNGADVNATDNEGRTPLHILASRPGLPDNIVPKSDRNIERVVKMFLEHGANPKIKDKNGQTAAQSAKNEAVKKLLELAEEGKMLPKLNMFGE